MSTTQPTARGAGAAGSAGRAAAIAAALQRWFGFDALRPMQREAIDCALDRRDALVVMPTGGGKSLCYQLPALVQDRLVVVVSPLALLPAAPAPEVFNPGRGKRGDAERDDAARTMGPPPLGVIAPGRGDTDRGVVLTGMVLMCVPRSSKSLGVALECGVERPMLLPPPSPSAAWRANANSRSASRASARAAAASASTKVRLGEALCADNCAEPRADCMGDSLRLVGGVARARSCCRCTCCDGG